MDYYKRALELDEDTVANRRYLHTNAECGLDTPRTKAFVKKRLTEYGLEPKDCGHGVTALLGREGGRVLLLRADMDALPMPEESGEPFACPTGTECHACGHDFHAAMLLTAARMLKENEEELEGTVKLMFQPGEESFEGSKDMIAHGVLENPQVDAALAYHVGPGKIPVGLYMYNDKSVMMYSVDGFKITIEGKGSHGAYPNNGVDPINIACHVHTALQALIARETDPAKACVLTIGSLQAGTAPNIIPDTAELQGTIRTNDPESRALLVRRLREVSAGVAASFGGSARVEMLSEVPPLQCDGDLTREFIGYMQGLGIPNMMGYPDIQASASEDFAVIAEQVPSTFMYLSAGFLDERGDYPAHNPKVRFNEGVCPIGAACLAHCATEWLKNNQ